MRHLEINITDTFPARWRKNPTHQIYTRLINHFTFKFNINWNW